MILRPYLLNSPVVPSSLETLSVRELMGTKWWDTQRKAAEALTEGCCVVCGVHKTVAKYKKWVEGHEVCTIDYDLKTVTVDEIVVLCHACHNYIHANRLLRFIDMGMMSKRKALDILTHGFGILNQRNLKPLPDHAMAFLTLSNYPPDKVLDVLRERGLIIPEDRHDTTTDWQLVIEGQSFTGAYSGYNDTDEKYYG